MSLFYNPLKMMRVEYNQQHGTDYPLEDFKVEQVVDLRDFAGARPDKKNTMVVAKVHGATVRFFYNRIDFNLNFARGFGLDSTSSNALYRLILDRDSNGSTKKLARPIARAYGLPITEADIAADPFTPPSVAGANPVKITFAKESLLFIPGSSTTFIIDEAYKVIDGKTYMVKDFTRNPDCFYEDHVARSRTAPTFLRISQLTYGNDYTAAGKWLRRLKANPVYVANESIGGTTDGEAFAALLAQALGQCDGLPWTFAKGTNAPFNLTAAWIIYNGPVAGAKKAALASTNTPAHLARLMELGNDSFDNVAVLMLPTYANTTTIVGAVLHYNNPKE